VADRQARDFFISYTGVNRPWAEWIAVQLEAAGYTTVLQAWDFGRARTSSMRCSRPPPRRAGGHRQLCG
jgi:TIR domain